MLGTTTSRLASSMSFSTARLGPESDALDVEVLVHRGQLLAKRHEVLLAAQQPAQQARELHDEDARRFGLRSNQRRDRRQRVEQEVRVDLIRERLDARGHQQLLLLGQPVLDARRVPDLDRDRDAKHGREHDKRVQPPFAGRQKEDARGVAVADRLAKHLEQDRRRDQEDLPVEREAPQESPGGVVELLPEERREAPDLFLRTDLPQAAAREPAADREGQRAPFTGEEWRDARPRRRRSPPRTGPRSTRPGTIRKASDPRRHSAGAAATRRQR